MLNIPIISLGSELKLITSGFHIRTVKIMALIIPSQNEFLLFWYYTSDLLHQSR